MMMYTIMMRTGNGFEKKTAGMDEIAEWMRNRLLAEADEAIDAMTELMAKIEDYETAATTHGRSGLAAKRAYELLELKMELSHVADMSGVCVLDVSSVPADKVMME